MNCPSCGHALDAAQLVCPACGQALEYRPAAAPESDSPESPWAAPGDWPEGADQPTTQLPEGTAPTGLPADHESTTELPTDGFGDPRQYLAATHRPAVRQYLPVSPAGPDGMPWGAAPAKPKKRLALPILLLTLVLTVTGGGVAAAGYYLGWFGSGPQPSDLMPATTLAYVQVDLDPSLSQKSQAWAFLRDLPQVKRAVDAGQPDPKRMLWEAIAPETGFADGTDYDTDIRPWLGNRAGFGVLGHDDQPAWVAAIQVTDEAAAAEKLRSWIEAGSQEFDVTTRDGYAVITPKADTDFVLGELGKGSLRNSETFRSDITALGETGVLAGWADLSALSQQKAFAEDADTEVQGRAAAALRFTSDTLALDGRFFAADTTGMDAPEAGRIGDLPRSTGAAITISGGAEAFKKSLSTLPGGFGSPFDAPGLDEADLAALLGRSLTLAVPSNTLADMVGASAGEVPEVGVRIVSDDVARARKVLHRLAQADDQGAPVFDQVDGDVLTAATSQHYLTQLVQPAARLSGHPPFARAVPDHARATMAAYLDLTPFVTADDDLGEYRDFVTSLQSLGAEVVAEADGAGSWSIRLVRS